MKNIYDISIERIKKIVSDKNTIYAFKGIDYKLYQLNVEDFIDGEISDFNYSESKQKILKDVMVKMASCDPFVISYDKLAVIINEISQVVTIMNYKIVIIVNNIYHNYFPLSDEFDPDEVASVIDHSLNDAIVSKLFSDYILIDGQMYVEYSNFSDLINVTYENIFTNDKYLYNPISLDDSSYIYNIGSTDESYTNFVKETLSSDGEINVSADRDTFLSYQNIYFNVLIELGYTLRFVKKYITKIVDDNKNEYLKILKRKNNNYEFRNISFYSDPGYSLVTKNISQSEIISALVLNAIKANNNEKFNDIFVTAPTGSGKSILFQIPAIYLAEKYNLLTIVVTPLIGLMNDQVDNIADMTDCAATINSEYTPEEKNEIKNKIENKEISILYVSPETLLSNNPISSLISDRKIGMMIIDEAHIVTTWGKSFRPDYWFLGDYVNYLRHKSKEGYNFPIATFSATITYGGNDDMHGDIIDGLKMNTGMFEYIAPMRRDDISFDIETYKDYSDYLYEKNETVVNSLKNLLKADKKTIAYFPFTSHIRDFRSEFESDKVAYYYGNLLKAEKDENMLSFKNSKKNLMLATKAFGMGIDIDDIEVVYHYAPTGNLCDYVQEIGRAARKQEIRGVAKTDFYLNDFKYIKQLYGMSSIKNFQIVETLKKLRQIYMIKKTRNFTVTPDEFSYIFQNDRGGYSEIDTYFKTTMLMIQKDFEKEKYLGFKPIIFKPRSMFTKGYFMVKDDIKKKFIRNSFHKYFALFSTSEDMSSNFIEHRKTKYVDKRDNLVKESNRKISTSIRYMGDIYVLDFKRMWEENFNNLSFAQFKHNFYSGELEGFEIGKELLPEYLLTLNVLEGKNFEDIIDVIKNIFEDIFYEISNSGLITKQFSVYEIVEILGRCKTIKLSRYELEMVAKSFIGIVNGYQNGSFNSQLVFKFNNQHEKYELISMALLKKKLDNIYYYAKSKFANVYQGNRRVFLLNMSNGTSNLNHNKEVQIAQLFEMFHLATYQVVSGERPEYFIRINSLSSIDRIINNPDYQSKMVQMVAERHNKSIEIMTHFFTELDNDLDRWNFIEKYFAGLID